MNDTLSKIDDIFKKSPVIHYKPGERILRPHESVSDILLIESGILRVYLTHSSGKEVTLCFYSATQFERFLIGAKYQTVNDYYVEAVTAVYLKKVPIPVFLNASNDSPDIGLYLASHYVQVIKFLYDQLRNSKYSTAYEKLAANMLMLCSIAGKPEGSDCEILFKINHQMIADLTGLTRETVTIQLKKFQQAGLISYSAQKLTIRKLETLKKIIDGGCPNDSI